MLISIWHETDSGDLCVIKIASVGPFWGMGLHRVSGETLEKAMKWGPDVIVAQGTSADDGPHYVVGDFPDGTRTAYKKEYERLLTTVRKWKVPFIISVGPGGNDAQVEAHLKLFDEIATERNLKMCICTISGEISKQYIKNKLIEGDKIVRETQTPRLPEYLSVEDVEQSECIVSQMGPEPIIKALDYDVDGIVTGRALDTALFAAYPIKKEIDKGVAYHVGKLMEITGARDRVVQEDKSAFHRGPLLCTIDRDHFFLMSSDSNYRCSVESVVWQSLYERDHPFRSQQTGGLLDLTGARYDQIDAETVKCSGAKFIPSEYAVKIEGVRRTGYRTIAIVGFRTPGVAEEIDRVLPMVENYVKENVPENYRLLFHIYGKNAVLGEVEPIEQTRSHEIGIVIEAVSDSQELARTVCNYARFSLQFMVRHGSGALPFSQPHIDMEPVYTFNIWHLMRLKDPCEPFEANVIDIPRRTSK